MSLDLTLNCTHCGSAVGDFNYTYNCAPMWKKAMPKSTRMVEIEGMTGAKSVPVLKKALAKLYANPEKFRKMDPENGWGSYDGFVQWLERLLECANKNPESVWSAGR